MTSIVKIKFRLVAPERVWKWEWGGHQSGAKRRKNLLLSCPSTFFVLKVQLVVLVNAFVMVSTVWSVFCLLFFYTGWRRGSVVRTSVSGFLVSGDFP